MKLTARVVVPVAIAGTLAVGAAAIAWADSPSPSPSPSSSSSQQDKQRPRGIERRALHGEFTVPQRGQRRTGSGPVATTVVYEQRGEVTAVDKNAKTITVKSRDNFTRSYVVTSDTKIRSKGGDAQFSDVAVGDRAMVLAEQQDGKYVARRLRFGSSG